MKYTFYFLFLMLITIIGIIPANAQWEKCDWPSGGREIPSIRCLAVSGTNLYAGTDYERIYSSTDNGTSWTLVTAGKSHGTLFLYASDSIILASYGEGVSRSTNNGSDWTVVDDLSMRTNYLIFKAIGSNLYAGTDSGVYLSTNNGINWNTVNAGLTNIRVHDLAVSGTNLFAGTEGGVFLSTNNGTSWTKVNIGLTDTVVYSLATSDSSLFAITSLGNVFRSINNGTSWMKVSTLLTVYGKLAALETSLFAIKRNDILRSTDKGLNWTSVTDGITNLDIWAFAENGVNLFVGTSIGGVFRSSNNGENWISVNNGLVVNCVQTLAVSPPEIPGSGYIFAGTLGDGIFLSTDEGTSWSSVNSGLSISGVYALSLLVTPPDSSGTRNILAGTWDGPYYSSNNGSSWIEGNIGSLSSSVRSFAICGANIFAGDQICGVLLSTDNGRNWTQVNNGIWDFRINCLGVIGTTIIANTYDGWSFLSTNNGMSWYAANTNRSGIRGYCLAVHETNLYAGASPGVYLSTNYGRSWNNVALSTVYVVSSLVFNGTNLFAGTSIGVFLSTDYGLSWTGVNSGLRDIHVLSLLISGNYLFAGTSSSGVWRRPLSEMITGVEDVPKQKPTRFILKQNYPNPFNPLTTIEFQIPPSPFYEKGERGGFVSLKVFDLLGREVATLVNERKPAGTYTVQWNASRMASGVYFYLLQAGEYTQTRKMLLIK